MKLIFIRHGDPDYVKDSLTEKGWKEAAALSNRVASWDNISEIYLSPLGRAKDTASLSLEKLGRNADIKDWLKEFYYPVYHKETDETTVPWDFYPENWTKFSDSYDKDDWHKIDLLNNPDILPAYNEVCKGLDEILSKYGYKRDGMYYLHSEEDKEDTIVFFCHLGVTIVCLSYLLGISPFVLWHAFFIAPTSVTIVGAEEREKGKASFRVQVMGDTTHLHDACEPISSAGYFTDCFQK